MRHIGDFPRPVREITTQWIAMPDGIRLAARIWLPEDAERDPVPAVLEYLPYRLSDGTVYRDAITQPYLAGHGYAAVRVDIRGTGNSEGIIRDEYDLVEQQDGVEIIAWLARQPWCSGKVGMWGISWGGFNALQIAARSPPALAAIITMGSTEDRYNGDCHYMGGCLIDGNISWGTTFLSGTSRPPLPEVVGAGWRAQWLKRLETMTVPIETWLAHQRRDAYWKPGSICEDYGRIGCAVYAISGWQDNYSKSVLTLMQNLPGPKKALIGPWAHAWPHMARPGPAIGFLQEAIRWFDHWLKGKPTGVMEEPCFRAWMGEWMRPARSVDHWPGRWIAETTWPVADAARLRLSLSAAGLRQHDAGPPCELAIKSAQTVGLGAGYWCPYGLVPDLSDDQREDDWGSLCFDSEPLPERLEILGEPALEIEIASDKPQALLAARLCDVAPDGSSLRVTYGLLNLTHRDGDEHPVPLEPGRRYRIRLELCGIAHAFPPGHRIRLALSTSYWPIAWPSPEAATLTLTTGASVLHLPVREPKPWLDDALAPFAEPEGAPPAALVETRPRVTERPMDRIEQDPASGRVELIRDRDRGAWRMAETGIEYDTQGSMRYSIQERDPLAARQEFTLTMTMGRPGWRVRTDVSTRLTATSGTFELRTTLTAHEGEERVFERCWEASLKRDNL